MHLATLQDHPPGDAARVGRLRARCLDRKADPVATACRSADRRMVVDAASLRRSEGMASWQRRMGLRTRARLEALRFATDDLDGLAGRVDCEGDPVPEAELEAARRYLASFEWPGGQTGHCALELERLFEVGVGGLVADIRAGLPEASGERAETLASFLDALEGLSVMVGHARDSVMGTAAASAPGWRRAELAVMAESCQRIRQDPPRTFRDAIQLLWLVNLGVEHADNAGLVSPGRLDRILQPFHDADTAAGRLTRDEALLLLESLYLLINHCVPDGLAVAVMVGGTDTDGADATHALSFLCLEALRRTRLIYPTVGVCRHPGTPRALSALACELIAAGYATPAFFNDTVIRSGLEHYGLPRSESWNYINSTCVEITPVGRSNVWVASPYFSLCQHLLEELDAQGAAPQPAASFEDFLDAYFARMSERIAEAVAEQRGLREDRRLHGRKPLQSVFTRDCVARARDIDDGGALTNWVECSFVGIANLADSLEVVRSEVFEKKTLGLHELKCILDADFAGSEHIRLAFLNGHPKYGNAEESVDRLVARIADVLRAECAKHRLPPDDAPFIPGTFCWVMHERLGSQCGATPDGRRRGEPFADGGGPAQGRERGGPTRSILSTTSWDHSRMIGGLAYNLKFSSELFSGPGTVDRLHDLVLTFLDRGGFETQINVVSRARLEAAERHPEQHRDLVVRIGGYTDYFVRLSPGMRREVMLRTEHAGL